ncbi:MAG: iron ABC transporter permease [Pseudomonadota bacterium]
MPRHAFARAYLARTTFKNWSVGARLLIGSGVALVAAAFASLAIGPTGISLFAIPQAIGAMFGNTDDVAALQSRLVLFDLRLPRTLIGMFVGAALAVAGAMMQGLFRNPLADPGLVGVSAGAALAAIATIALGDSLAAFWVNTLGIYALPVSAFLGGIITTTLLMIVAGHSGQLMMGTLLLAGIAFGALAGAASGLIAYASDDRELRDLTLWSMGSLTGSSWEKVAAVAPFALIIGVAIPSLVRALNGLLLGEAEAYHLGIDVPRAKLVIVAITAAAVGAAVAVAGVIGFVGIVVPHFVRLIAGPDHRVLLPATALIGATVILAADVVARTIVAPSELPIGIVMAIIGAPIFLHLVLRRGML